MATTRPMNEPAIRWQSVMIFFVVFAAVATRNVDAQTLPDRIQIVNMIPSALSGESDQDSEPNIAVDPANPRNIVGSAMTLNPTGATDRAPVFVSQDGGKTWGLNNILPSGDGKTNDISLAFSTAGSIIYAGILLGGEEYRMNILRSANPFGSNVMDVLVDRDQIDQPWVEAQTAAHGAGTADRVFVGNNDRKFRIDPTNPGADGKTASVEVSQDAATAPAPAGFSQIRIEVRSTNKQDMPAIRTAVHNDGTVYAVFYRRVAGVPPDITCDVIVVRDDNWASGSNPFQALKDSSDGQSGMRVVQGVLVRAGFALPTGPFLGENRLAGSNLSIAVDPRKSKTVWIAWADQVGAAYTLHVRRSDDGGLTWSLDLLTVSDATNPALSINITGQVGFLYQQVVGAAPNQRWQTHFQRTATGATWRDLILANTPVDDPPPTQVQPYIGDYADLVAVGSTFYGVFSASNIPDTGNFPNGVTYQRSANFSTHTLLDVAGAPVKASIDPFFFSVSPPSIVDRCKAAPGLCSAPVLTRGLIKFTCKVIPCLVVDPLPRNCQVKFSCPGCPPGGLCPPWYHISIKGLDRKRWNVGIYHSDGSATDYRLHDTANGVVVSLKPAAKDFKAGSVGDFVLAFESQKARKRQRFAFPTRLDVTSQP
jgi:hypothetical protein